MSQYTKNSEIRPVNCKACACQPK